MSFECGEKMSEIQYLDSIVMVCQLNLVFLMLHLRDRDFLCYLRYPSSLV